MKINDNGIVRDMTEEEMSQNQNTNTAEIQIAELKQNLADTDYKAIKYAEGFIDEVDYQPIRLQRQLWRDEINKLETQIKWGNK